jgi:hypothetical protein
LSWNLSLKEEGSKEEEFKGKGSLKEEGVIVVVVVKGGGQGGEVKGQLNASS